ncbi:phage major capsid protein [Micromonospora taraxaci]|uniref:phage major capsid protein n=1 Tax=Micromonospora taraxaci TaxID=1316803 RepID=UPI003C2F3299
MPTLQERRESRANMFEQMKEILARTDNDPQGQDLETYNRIDADLDREDEIIVRQEKAAAREKDYNRVDRTGVVPADGGEPKNEDEAKYLNAWSEFLRSGTQDMDPESRKVLNTRRANLPKNAAGVGTGAAGGYAVPPEFRDKFMQTLKYFGPMLQEAEIIETDTGANLPWPTNDDTGNVGAILAENTQVTEQDVTLGTASIDAYMYTSKLVRVSFQLMQDLPGFEGWLMERLGERLGRILNTHFTTGTGSSQPNGIVTGGTVGATGAGSFGSTGVLGSGKGDVLIDLIESLDPAYGASTNLKFMGHQAVRKAVRKLQDGQGRYMWEVSLQNGVPDSLLGYQFLINNDMPTPAASSKSLLFGDIRAAYLARIVRELTTLRLTERYADYLQVGFLAFERADGEVQNANAYRVYQTSATA